MIEPNTMVHMATYDSLMVDLERVANVESIKILNQTAIKPLQFTSQFFTQSFLYRSNKYA